MLRGCGWPTLAQLDAIKLALTFAAESDPHRRHVRAFLSVATGADAEKAGQLLEKAERNGLGGG